MAARRQQSAGQAGLSVLLLFSHGGARELSMPNLDERVTTLEREMSALKARVGANEEDLQSIPDLIRMEFRLGNSQIARLSRDVAQLQRDVAGLQGDFGGLNARVEAMPRAVAELVAEMLAERDKKR
jgi:hypothetical protein